MKNKVSEMFKFPAAVLKPIRDYLKSEEKRLKDKKVRLKKEDPFSDPDRVDDNAASDTDVNEQVGHERVQAIKLEVDKGLINIRKALTRIKVGNYGICANCGEMIDTDRLAINPTAEFCMECEREKEAKKRK
jgi:RNA polymerase-binding transcription factor DksA